MVNAELLPAASMALTKCNSENSHCFVEGHHSSSISHEMLYTMVALFQVNHSISTCSYFETLGKAFNHLKTLFLFSKENNWHFSELCAHEVKKVLVKEMDGSFDS